MPKSQHEINQWIRSQQMRLGIKPSETTSNGGSVSTVTVMLPTMAAATLLAHAAADAKIGVDPVYATMCERLDAELREILEGYETDSLPMRRSKHSRKSGSGPRVLTND